MIIIPPNAPDLLTKARFPGTPKNIDWVQCAVIVPSPINVPVYGKLVAEVRTYSNNVAKRGYHYRGLYSLEGLNWQQAIDKAAVLAGALSEELIKVYKDKCEPAEYAKEAHHGMQDALKNFEKGLSQKLPGDTSLDEIKQALRELQALQ